jgi:hypothetical protein
MSQSNANKTQLSEEALTIMSQKAGRITNSVREATPASSCGTEIVVLYA